MYARNQYSAKLTHFSYIFMEVINQRIRILMAILLHVMDILRASHALWIDEATVTLDIVVWVRWWQGRVLRYLTHSYL